MGTHEQRAHALLSASGSKRWLNCTPSARLEDKIKDEQSSIFAQEGTLAHELSEAILRRKLDFITPKQYRDELDRIENHDLYSEEMPEHVDVYTQFVLDTLEQRRREGRTPIITIEARLDFSEYVKDGFGTGDATILADGILDVIDLKYGKGVEVSAHMNSQLMLYGLGALREAELLGDVDTLRLTIVQPRLHNIDTFEISADELKAWGEGIVKPRADMADRGEGDQVTGDWCQFCKVAATCKALSEDAMKLAQDDFKDPRTLTDSEFIEAYGKIKRVSGWIKAAEAHALKAALDGKQWDGYKVVESKTNRKITDQDKALEILEAEGFERAELVNVKIKGFGDLEKLVTKAKFNKLVGPFIVKPPGAPTLVPESDKRPPFQRPTVEDDFGE